MAYATDTFSGILTPLGNEGVDVQEHFDEFKNSMRDRVLGIFASKATRDSATTALVAADATVIGMVAYVTGLGWCGYDDNARSGSGGWTWFAQEQKVLDLGPLNSSSSSDTPTVITSGNDVVLPSKRSVEVSLVATIRNSDISPLVSSAGGRVYCTRNGTEILRVQAPINSAYSQAISQVTLQRSIKFNLNAGTHTFNVSCLREGGSGGGYEVRDMYLQVTDWGPAD